MNGSARSPGVIRVGAAFRAWPWSGPAPASGWAEVFEVFANDEPAAPAMLGSYARDGEAVVFTPRFSPSAEVRLRAVYRPPGAAPVVARFFDVPEPPRAPTTRIVSVTPSGGVWPENILKLYVTFSAPMRIGIAWDHIRLLDAAGDPAPGMFVEIDQELWDPRGERLTVLFDPARIKRGLVDNINEGPPLIAGQRYTLEIDAFWWDAAGRRLVEPLRRAIEVDPPLRTPIDPSRWRLTPPVRLTDPLIVDFERALDAALAVRALSVRAGEARAPCDAELECGETRLVLHPIRPWAPGRYTLHADSILEDIAGNRIGRPFDIDTHDQGQRNAIARSAERSFDVAGAST